MFFNIHICAMFSETVTDIARYTDDNNPYYGRNSTDDTTPKLSKAAEYLFLLCW